MRGKIRKGIAFVLSAVIGVATCITIIPQTSVPVYAAGTGKNLQLGASALAPVMTSVQEQGYDPDEKYRVTTAQTVYYGSSGTWKWYVIGADDTGAVKMEDTVTLFAENNLGSSTAYHNPSDTSTRSNHYKGSDIKLIVDGYYDSLFTDIEKSQIAERNLYHGQYNPDSRSFCDGVSDANGAGGAPATKANLWLLSTKEADLVGRSYREARYFWWLRSPGDTDGKAAIVNGNAKFYSNGTSVNEGDGGVRPAFNINLSSIILTSAAVGGKSSGTVGAAALTAPTSCTGNEWKLTLLDSDRSFSAERTDSGIVGTGKNISISYSDATVGDNEYVSAILLNSSGDLLYYGRIVDKSTGNTDGTANIMIPEDLAAGTYTIKLFSEQYHPDKKTDYVSCFSNPISVEVLRTPSADDFVVTLPSDTVYDGSSKTVSVDKATGVTGMGEITIKYYDRDDHVLTEAPKEIGTYKVKLDVAAGTNYTEAANITDDSWTFTISPAGTVATPTFSPVAGKYSSAQNVTISCSTDGATIHYTTDGSTPTASSPTYSSAITVSESKTIKAFAVKEGMTNSEVATAKYSISDSPVPPIPPTPPITETCTISFDANGGKGEMKDQTVDKGVKTQLKENAFTRDGYSFTNWNTQADGKGKSYEDKDYITAEKDTTLYAQWEKGKIRPRPRKHDDDESSSNEEASKPAVVNPDTVEGYFAVNGQLLPGVTMGKTKQGVAAQAVFNASRPVGWQEAFTFNMAINGKVDYTLKNGVLTIIIPKEFQKAGRTFAIMALDKNGKAWTFADTDTNPATVTATINVEGYAFALIYKD